MFTVTVTWGSSNPNTIANRLAVNLGRQPTDAEVTRILTNTGEMTDAY